MGKFARLVDAIEWESENVGYNPEKDTNWNNLSEELKKECFKRMDAKTGTRLKSASSTERSLLKLDTRQQRARFRYSSPDRRSNIDKARDNVILRSKTVGYDPKNDVNWDFLSYDLQYECVKWMDFKTRNRLGATSKNEDSLIFLAPKYKFVALQLMCLGYSRFMINAFSTNKREFSKTFLDGDAAGDCLNRFLAYCEFDVFHCYNVKNWGDPIQDILEKLREDESQNCFKKITFEWVDPEICMFFLERNPELRIVVFKEDDLYLQPYFDLPAITNTKKLCFRHADDLDLMWKLVQKWIRRDAEIGTSLAFCVKARDIIESFVKKFADRIIDIKADLVRIRMDNSTAQIIMRTLEYSTDCGKCALAKVLPIDAPEHEYTKEEEWFDKSLIKYLD